MERLMEAEYKRFQITWSDVGQFLNRYKWPIVIAFVTTVLATYCVLSLYSDRYESRAALLVKIGRENTDPPATAGSRGGTLVSSGVRKEEVASEVQILTSPDIIQQVVDRIGPARFQPSTVLPDGFVARTKFHLKQAVRAVKADLEEALIALGLQKRLNEREKVIQALMKEVSVAPEKETDVVTIKLRTGDPRLGNDILQEWISIYMTRRVQIRANSGVREFLTRETEVARQKLETSESARNQWKQVHGLSLTVAQKETLIRQIREQSAAHDLTELEIKSLSGQLDQERRLLQATPSNVKTTEVETTNSPVQVFRNELAGLEVERSKQLSKYEASSEPVKLLDEQIVRLKQLIGNETPRQISSSTTELNPLAKSLELRLQEDSVRLEGLQGRALAQANQQKALSGQLNALEDADGKLADLERERQIAEDAYFALVKRRHEAEISGELDRDRLSNVSLLSFPTSSIEPVYPRRQLVMGISLVLGLVLGIALSLVYEMLSGKVRSPGELAELTALPFLGRIRLPEGARP
jgi:succinoglycan biosynthesis transport protein ExoP